jgi:DNA (cytosine-5)-methyltransferase 1
MGHPRPRFAWRSRFSDFLHVADPSKPTKTIVAQPGKWAGPFHWNKRKFMIPELKRLFTFPDEYIVKGSEINVIRQLGNSVPPKFAFSLAKAVKNQLFGGGEEIDLIDDDFLFDYDRRKARKSELTKRLVRPNSSIYHSKQQLLFRADEEFDTIFVSEFKKSLSYTLYRAVHDISNRDSSGKNKIFNTRGRLRNGHWKISQTESPRGRFRSQLIVNFIKPIQGKIVDIIVDFRTGDLSYLGAMWDAVDFGIQSCTSYDNIQKLYGHFTEPYPQFSCRIDSEIDSPIIKFAKQLCDFSYLKTYHSLEDLERLFGKEKDGLSYAKWLRELGFDIRTNETNRTIPEGYFRVCYPFTIPLTSRQFVSWVEKGHHRTADKTSIPQKKL